MLQAKGKAVAAKAKQGAEPKSAVKAERKLVKEEPKTSRRMAEAVDNEPDADAVPPAFSEYTRVSKSEPAAAARAGTPGPKKVAPGKAKPKGKAGKGAKGASSAGKQGGRDPDTPALPARKKARADGMWTPCLICLKDPKDCTEQ